MTGLRWLSGGDGYVLSGTAQRVMLRTTGPRGARWQVWLNGRRDPTGHATLRDAKAAGLVAARAAARARAGEGAYADTAGPTD